jgi:DNA-binding response OmpR family regulator
MRILIIEAEPTVAGLVAEALAHQGHQTTVALGGKEGLEGSSPTRRARCSWTS